jgi:hypothetical protein
LIQYPDANGERQIWLEPAVIDRLCALRDRDESYSDVILRLASGCGPAVLERRHERGAPFLMVDGSSILERFQACL